MKRNSTRLNRDRRYPGRDDGRIVAEFLNSSQKREKKDREWFSVDLPIEIAIKGAFFFRDGDETVLLPTMTVPLAWSITSGGKLELVSDLPAANAMLAAQRLDQIGRLRRVRPCEGLKRVRPRGQELEPCGRWFYASKNTKRFCSQKCAQLDYYERTGTEYYRLKVQKSRKKKKRKDRIWAEQMWRELGLTIRRRDDRVLKREGTAFSRRGR